MGAGRTDAGVHARGQMAHFSFDSTLDYHQTLYALNGMLPRDIRIQELAPTLATFHAQYAATSKEYHYHVWTQKILDPFCRLYRHHCCYPAFSLPSLQEAALHFIGMHDFATFANVGGSTATTIRSLYRLDMCEQEGGFRLEFEGNGFLYKMVRNIVGTLLEVAKNKRSASEIPALLAAKDRRVAGAAAPPHGLFLEKVSYPPQFLANSSVLNPVIQFEQTIVAILSERKLPYAKMFYAARKEVSNDSILKRVPLIEGRRLSIFAWGARVR